MIGAVWASADEAKINKEPPWGQRRRKMFEKRDRKIEEFDPPSPEAKAAREEYLKRLAELESLPAFPPMPASGRGEIVEYVYEGGEYA